jgi:phospholipid/cholesterol/gamma-HCH transport system substrate-binding protein
VTQFRERNPIPIALVGIVVIVGLLLLALDAANISFLGGGGKTVRAYFVESSDLQKSDDVRIAGIKVGEVKAVKLATIEEKGVPTQVVEVTMHVTSGTTVDDASTASIRIKTLLGAMYVDIVPAGNAPLRRPIDTTGDPEATPLIVTAAFQQLSQQISQIDTTQLAESFNVLSSDFSGTSGDVASTLKGLSALSQTISSRDAALQQLLGHAQGVTTALASRDAQVTRLIDDGQTVLTLVDQQRTVIHDLLLNTVALSQQLTALVKENTGTLAPALANLKSVTDILSRDQTGLDQSIYLLAPFIRDFTNTIGNGEWFDNVVQNLSSLATPGCFTLSLTASPTQQVATGTSPGAGCL